MLHPPARALMTSGQTRGWRALNSKRPLNSLLLKRPLLTSIAQARSRLRSPVDLIGPRAIRDALARFTADARQAFSIQAPNRAGSRSASGGPLGWVAGISALFSATVRRGGRRTGRLENFSRPATGRRRAATADSARRSRGRRSVRRPWISAVINEIAAGDPMATANTRPGEADFEVLLKFLRPRAGGAESGSARVREHRDHHRSHVRGLARESDVRRAAAYWRRCRPSEGGERNPLLEHGLLKRPGGRIGVRRRG